MAVSSAVRERPINLKAHEVTAILAGRKTQCRRLVMNPSCEWEKVSNFVNVFGSMFSHMLGSEIAQHTRPVLARLVCPFGQPGDRLWVRETFSFEHASGYGDPPFDDGRPIKRRSDDDEDCLQAEWIQPHYSATDPAPDLCCEKDSCGECRDNHYGPHWRSSAQMPRWASRILLEVVSVRVERLQDISERDARAEGIEHQVGWLPQYRGSPELPWRSEFPRDAYKDLWHRFNGPDSWDKNPWVWVIEFKWVEA